MNIPKALITAAGRNQRHLPLQTIVDRDGYPRSVLTHLVDEAVSAGIEKAASSPARATRTSAAAPPSHMRGELPLSNKPNRTATAMRFAAGANSSATICFC